MILPPAIGRSLDYWLANRAPALTIRGLPVIWTTFGEVPPPIYWHKLHLPRTQHEARRAACRMRLSWRQLKRHWTVVAHQPATEPDGTSYWVTVGGPRPHWGGFAISSTLPPATNDELRAALEEARPEFRPPRTSKGYGGAPGFQMLPIN